MSRRALIAAATSVVVALLCLTVWWQTTTDEPASTAAPDRAPVEAAQPVLQTTAEKATPAEPVRLGVPSIGVSTRLVGLGLHDDGTVEVPTDPDRAGWFDLGTTPGQVGSAVLLGHVDSVHGPAVFARLSDLERGDSVRVQLSDRSMVRFRVRAVRTYPNADFPARKVYTGHGRPTLTLVTCGGDYDRTRGGYQANVVVYAELA